MKRCFLCTPYQGKEVNLIRAEEQCRYMVRKGWAVIAPHLLYTRFLREHSLIERDLGIEAGSMWIPVCDYFFIDVFEEEDLTAGMAIELAIAKTHDIKIRYLGIDVPRGELIPGPKFVDSIRR